jgi:hypothetical protein
MSSRASKTGAQSHRLRKLDRPVIVRLSDEMYEKLKAAATADPQSVGAMDQSVSAFIRRILVKELT